MLKVYIYANPRHNKLPNKIELIKVHRMLNRDKLKDSKDYIESMLEFDGMDLKPIDPIMDALSDRKAKGYSTRFGEPLLVYDISDKMEGILCHLFDAFREWEWVTPDSIVIHMQKE